MDSIDRKIAILEQWKETTDDLLGRIVDDIKEIKDNLLRRPSWAVLVIITFLSSTTIGLLVAFLSKR